MKATRKKNWRQTAIHSNPRKTEIMKFWMSSIEMLNIRIGVYVLYASDEAETLFFSITKHFCLRSNFVYMLRKTSFSKKSKIPTKNSLVLRGNSSSLCALHSLWYTIFNDINIFVYIILHKAKFSLFSPR